MRTKQTSHKGDATSSSNGMASATPKRMRQNAPADMRSPAQPPELSDSDRDKLKIFLDRAEKPFTVATYATSGKKRKRNAKTYTLQEDLWQDRLAVQYDVKPRDKWESLRRYKKFTVGSESIATGQCILVKHDEREEAKIDVANQWKAKVLEVRALDSEHVYIRVAWLNRPEDLHAGRKPYHGKNELIPTNQMDVIDAMAVNGSLEVNHWDDAEDESAMLEDDQFFWRQTFDLVNTGTFSKLRLICIDSAPQNPDELILQCSNETCRKWLHVKCIAERAAQQADSHASGKQNGVNSAAKKRGRPKNPSISNDSSAVAKAVKGKFSSEIFIKDLPQGPDVTPATSTEIIVTDDKGVQYSEELCCLFCDQAVKD
ncbi:uncharacterized protein RCC_05325 [Ramularia collo-cygni]|uniref:BAH domain-containing protein n=1 Tax=Ramularia collo-cygni TaxID=112498 RepID=A0A2D3VA12_9PEZI|nr:uncharacterized protein RCC_05325 [Ramularia collo-cygni]CZT19474.1 uncharacterized protein RCC_05325 [Ramularia collo-cygni]